KVDDLFAGRGVRSINTATNQEAYDLISGALETMRRGLLLANVIEFDERWGHRNDVPGFARGLAELDHWRRRLTGAVRGDDPTIMSADHRIAPSTSTRDHGREQVPILVLGGAVRPVSIGTRQSFADVGQTVAQFLGVPALDAGTSFLDEVWAA